jgi:UDP-N-acetylmuramyl tripeptide synthase
MRLIGLTLCFLVSSFGARAESVEDRVAALEARVKALEQALRVQGGNAAPAVAINIDGTYKAVLPNGDTVTAQFQKGTVTAATGTETKTGTYEVIGQKVIVAADGKVEAMSIEGDHLKMTEGNDKIDFIKTK